MNGHVGCNIIDYDRVHEGNGFGERVEAVRKNTWL